MSFVIVDMTAVGAGVDTVTGMGVGVGVADPEPEPAGLITCKYLSGMWPIPVRPGSVSTGIDPMCRGPASLKGPLSLLSQQCGRGRRTSHANGRWPSTGA